MYIHLSKINMATTEVKHYALYILTDIVVPAGCDTIDCSKAAGCTLNETNSPLCFCNNGFKLQNDNTCDSK